MRRLTRITQAADLEPMAAQWRRMAARALERERPDAAADLHAKAVAAEGEARRLRGRADGT